MSKEHKIRIGKLFQITYWRKFPCFEITFSKCGYFDGRPQIELGLLFCYIVIHLPWINERWTDECDPPKYGVGINYNTIYIYRGGYGNMYGGNRWWSFEIPFLNWHFHKQYVMGKDDKWIDITYKRWDSDERRFVDEKVGSLDWNNNGLVSDEDSLAKIYYGKWIDDYDGKIIDAKFRVEKRVWRRKWLEWTSFLQDEVKSIEVCFKEEVGSRKGSWKGGVLGAGCEFKEEDNDDPILCFTRMNKEKKW